MAEAKKKVVVEEVEKVEADVPLCWNCQNPLVGTKCPECGFDSSTIINYHDL